LDAVERTEQEDTPQMLGRHRGASLADIQPGKDCAQLLEHVTPETPNPPQWMIL